MQSKLWTLSALAVELGRDRRALARDLEGLAPDDEQVVGERTSRRWRLRRVIERLYARQDEREFDPVQERARKDAEMADKLAMANAVTRGEMIPRQRVLDDVGGYIDGCRARLAHLAPRIAALLDPDAGRRLEPQIKEIVQEAIAELRGYRPWRQPGQTDSTHN